MFGRAERQAADRAQLLLELAGDAGVDGEVAGVVRARRQFVDQQSAVARHEELDAQHADHFQLFEHRAGDLDRVARRLARVTRAGAIETSRMWRLCWFSIAP